MAKSRSDDEGFEENPRPRSQGRPSRRDDDDGDDRSARRARNRRDEDEDDDDRPARRARSRREDDEDDDDRPRRKRSRDGGGSGIIPYRNPLALIAYYSGFGSLISILGSVALAMLTIGQRVNVLLIGILMFGVGGLLALLAVICGILGLTYVNKHPKARGTGHAVTGLIMGGIEILALIGLILFGFLMQRR
jgi:hypothetical protein